MEDIERIKDAANIVAVTEKLGFKFEYDHGVSRRVSGAGGLVINTKSQRYFWVAKGWNGDAVDLVMRRMGVDFKGAIEWMADNFNVQRPNWGKVDPVQIKAQRTKETVFDVAGRVFHEWLLKDAEALAYAKGRGLTDKTIADARLGFSGRGGDAYADMRGEFNLYQVDPECPAAVSILGFRGDVAGWGKAHDVDVPSEWSEKGHVSGMLSVPGLVYQHYFGNKLRYFTRRHLPGHDRITDQKTGESREWKSWNPPVALVGDRHFYFNHAWRQDAQECLIVEGQMDAVTLGQYGMAAVALCGLGSQPEALGSLKQRLAKHLVIYLALDNDGPGLEKVRKLSVMFGPMTRVIRWPKGAVSFTVVNSDQGDQAEDELLDDAMEIAEEAAAEGRKVTISGLQRRLGVGYTRAGKLHHLVTERLAASESEGEVVNSFPAAAEAGVVEAAL